MNINNHFKIIVPSYNNEKWLQACLRSVKLQTYDNYQCIIVDDCSSDKSVEIIDPKAYVPSLGDGWYRPSIKLLAKIESVQTRDGEGEEGEEGEEAEVAAADLTPDQQAQSDALAFKPGPE